MSDGMSGISRDEERVEDIVKYYGSLADYLRDCSEENHTALIKAAEEVDSVRGGYISGRTYLANNLDKKLEKLEAKDEKDWLKTLMSVEDIMRRGRNVHNELLEISPFAEDTLTLLRYGSGFVRDFEGPLSGIVDCMLRGKNIKTFDGGSYVVVLPEEKLKQIRDLLEYARVHDLD